MYVHINTYVHTYIYIRQHRGSLFMHVKYC
jgi:hypothetical protein